MKKIIFIALVLNLSIVYSQTQQVIPPSPTASSLGSYVDNPVSLYTGKPAIDIPLYEIKVKAFTLPISLSYNAGGIKVGDIASNVGLGWSLNAGGVITRAVMDIPDDFGSPKLPGEGICTYSSANLEQINNSRKGILKHLESIPFDDLDNFTLNDLLGKGYFCSSKYKIYDTEPDIFYFNFCGIQGKFYFDTQGGGMLIRSVPYQGLAITCNYSSWGLLGFTIIDRKGIKYTFSNSIESVYIFEECAKYIPSLTSYGSYDYRYRDIIDGPSYDKETSYYSSWYLKTIETPDGETITFSYTGQILKDKSLPNEQSWGVYFSDGVYGNDYNPNDPEPNTYCAQKSISTTHYALILSKIETSTASVEIKSEYARPDFSEQGDETPHAISGIEVYSKFNSELIKKFEFEYGEFCSDITENIKYRPGKVLTYSEDDNYIYYKRFYLKNITEYDKYGLSSKPPYRFEYKYKDFTGNPDHILPHRLSLQRDLWGFYNGASSNNTLIPQLHFYQTLKDGRRFSVYNLPNMNNPIILNGANRLPNPNLTDIGMLTKIIYPTGGATEYEYEPHKFLYLGNELEGGGLRIKKIIKYSNKENPAITYNYNYLNTDGSPSGTLISMPLFGMNASEISTVYSETILDFISYSMPQNQLGSTQGSRIGYKRVIESISGNGKTIYTFDTPLTGKKPEKMFYFQKHLEFIDPNCEPVDPDPYDYVLPIFNDCFESEYQQEVNSDGCEMYCPYIEHLSCMLDIDDSYIENNVDLGSLKTPSPYLTYPYPPMMNNDWNMGQLLTKTVYDENGNPVKKEELEYELYYPYDKTAPREVFGVKFGVWHPETWDDFYNNVFTGFRFAPYKYLTDVSKVLSSKTITEYGTDGNSISNTITYKYQGKYHNNITEQTEETSTSDTLKTTFRYPFDFMDSEANEVPEYDTDRVMDGIEKSMSKNKNFPPIEVVKYRNGNVISAQLNTCTYDYDRGKIIPYYYCELETAIPLEKGSGIDQFLDSHDGWADDNYTLCFFYDDHYSKRIEFKKFDSKNNIVEIDDKTTGLTTSYIWGYEQQYPIAKIVNASYSEVQPYVSNLQSLSDADIDEISEENLRTALNNLRSSLPSAMVSTFTYDPLIGMTSQTDPKGMTTYYEYDDFGRLIRVKDHEGNILQEYTYNYMSQ